MSEWADPEKADAGPLVAGVGVVVELSEDWGPPCVTLWLSEIVALLLVELLWLPFAEKEAPPPPADEEYEWRVDEHGSDVWRWLAAPVLLYKCCKLLPLAVVGPVWTAAAEAEDTAIGAESVTAVWAAAGRKSTGGWRIAGGTIDKISRASPALISLPGNSTNKKFKNLETKNKMIWHKYAYGQKTNIPHDPIVPISYIKALTSRLRCEALKTLYTHTHTYHWWLSLCHHYPHDRVSFLPISLHTGGNFSHQNLLIGPAERPRIKAAQY